MRMHLNTLFVTTEGAYVSRDGETVVVKVENDVRLRAPVHTLASLVTFGRVSCSPPLLALCGERGVSVTFLSEHGRFLARVEGPVSGNVLEQYIARLRRKLDVPFGRADIETLPRVGYRIRSPR